MLFGKRRWAYRVIERAGYRVTTPLGVALVKMLVDGAKASERALRKPGDLLHVANAALALHHSSEARDELAKVRGGTPEVAARISVAARELTHA